MVYSYTLHAYSGTAINNRNYYRMENMACKAIGLKV